MKNIVITVARGFGSGGKKIASQVAKDLGIHCYENRILTLASQMSGVEEDVFREVNEKIRGKRVERRKSMSVIEKGQSSAQRKASYARQKNTPCKESLALPRPYITNSTADSLTIPLSRAADDDSSDGDPPPGMPNYGVYTPGM